MAESDWRTDIENGYRTKIIRTEKFTVKIHRPILSDSERRKAEEQVKRAIPLMFES